MVQVIFACRWIKCFTFINDEQVLQPWLCPRHNRLQGGRTSDLYVSLDLFSRFKLVKSFIPPS